MCPSRCFDGTDACSENVTGVSVWEIGCTYQSGETADACGRRVMGLGVWEIGCTYRSGETADACSEIAIKMGVREIGCTYRSGETADACGIGRWNSQKREVWLITKMLLAKTNLL